MPVHNQKFDCEVFPSVPDFMSHETSAPRATIGKREVRLSNRFMDVIIPADSGIIAEIFNRTTGSRRRLQDDQAGFTAITKRGSLKWSTGGPSRHPFQVTANNTADTATVAFQLAVEEFIVVLEYTLHRDRFWLERRLELSCAAPFKLEAQQYGKLAADKVSENVLELGAFDRPRLLTFDEDGLFGGVGWWFYSVDAEGVYGNSDMDFPVAQSFRSEPWYLGVFKTEAGEPFVGWLWYKTFLRMRKEELDAQRFWSYWNAGWGQWGLDIDNPDALPYLELIRKMGIRQIAFGSGGYGKGLEEYVRLAQNDPATRQNVAWLREHDISFGFLDHLGLKEKWTDIALVDGKLQLLDAAAQAGISALHFDFFSTVDTFTAHYNVARYLRAAREKFAYTECHLGMAHYGPQFQREVLVNHPTDTHGFDIAPFSADWATFLSFRHSRRQWQQQYRYLMPEYGLYYFLTHYSNAHPRIYNDPEPQQFTYRVHAFCGIGWNFHDLVGFRTALAAAAAFSPFYVFGHLELTMPDNDTVFARAFQEWVEAHADLLHPDRVFREDERGCVVGKITNGRGLVFVLNYQPQPLVASLVLRLPENGAIRWRPVYPVREPARTLGSSKTIDVTVPGDSVVILEINDALRSPPPENPNRTFVAVTNWQPAGNGWEARVTVPDIREQLRDSVKTPVPRELLSIDQFSEDEQWAVNLTRELGFDGVTRILPVHVDWLQPSNFGRGRLQPEYMEACGFRDTLHIETWRIAPWAHGDRLWLVWRPTKPLSLNLPLPVCRLNDTVLTLTPRVDYRPEKVAEWSCPVFFADATTACVHGSANVISVSGLPREGSPGTWCFVAADG